MPVNQLVNTLGQSGETPGTGGFVMQMQYDPAASGNLLSGNIVAIETGTTTPWLIKKATTTPDFLMWGVVVDAPTGGNTPGSSTTVLVEGIAQVLFDANNTTAGHLALQSSTTAGTCTDSATATLAKTLGTILQTLTISSGTALVWVAVHKM
jgi:uncharacterized protein involved in propanediol utilization